MPAHTWGWQDSHGFVFVQCGNAMLLVYVTCRSPVDCIMSLQSDSHITYYLLIKMTVVLVADKAIYYNTVYTNFISP